MVLKTELLSMSAGETLFSCSYSAFLNKESPRTRTRCITARPKNVQQGTPAALLVRHIMDATPVQQFSTPTKTQSRGFCLFASIGTQANDKRKPCQCVVSLDKPLKLPLHFYTFTGKRHCTNAKADETNLDIVRTNNGRGLYKDMRPQYRSSSEPSPCFHDTQ